MFDQLINEAASRFNLSTASVAAIVRGLLSMMTSERTGGPEGFGDLFRRAGIGDVITSSLGGKETQIITPTQIDSALGVTAIDKLAATSGLARTVVSAVAAFLLPRLIGRLSPTGVLPSRQALASQVSSYLDGPELATVNHRIERQPERSPWARWIPLAALALLALGALLWLRAPAGSVDPQLTLTNREGMVTYSGVVRDEATRSTIISALRNEFGEHNVVGDLRVDRNVRTASWLPRLNELFSALNRPGVDVSLTGDVINLGGWLSAADRQSLSERLRGLLGAGANIGSLSDAAVDAARAANDRALSALSAIGTSGVNADAVVQAMNLAVINFSSGSAEIAPDSLEVIRKSAEAIRRAPAATKVEIGGHTDNTGNPTSNLRLSEMRAEAVKAALVSAAVPADRLTTRGYGDTRPRASNDSEYGRFQNRRIEYAVVR